MADFLRSPGGAQLQSLVGDAIFGVVQVETHSLDRHPLAARRIFCEELPQMKRGDLFIVGLERFPRLPFDRRVFHVWLDVCFHAHAPLIPACFNKALLEEITASNSFHDVTNDLAPSFCSCSARASTSIPALANCANTSSELPPSSGSNSPNSLCAARAFNVPSG